MGSMTRIRSVSRRYPDAKIPSAQIENSVSGYPTSLLTLREIGRRRASAKNALEKTCVFTRIRGYRKHTGVFTRIRLIQYPPTIADTPESQRNPPQSVSRHELHAPRAAPYGGGSTRLRATHAAPATIGDPVSDEMEKDRGMSAEPLDRRDLLHDLQAGETQCTARSKRTGKRCRAPSMLGGNVCRAHGGAAPQTRAKAQRRLVQAADVLVQRLLGLALTVKHRMLLHYRQFGMHSTAPAWVSSSPLSFRPNHSRHGRKSWAISPWRLGELPAPSTALGAGRDPTSHRCHSPYPHPK
jgi:hypothetical protein